MKMSKEDWLSMVALFLLLYAAGGALAGGESEQKDKAGELEGRAGAVSRWSDEAAPPVPWRRMAYAGGFVLAVGGLALYLWKRRGFRAGGTLTEVLESRSVDGQMSIHLLRVGDRVFVVASTGDAVGKIGEVDEDALPEPDAGGRASGGSHFRTVLRTVLGGRQG